MLSYLWGDGGYIKCVLFLLRDYVSYCISKEVKWYKNLLLFIRCGGCDFVLELFFGYGK